MHPVAPVSDAETDARRRNAQGAWLPGAAAVLCCITGKRARHDAGSSLCVMH
jgi:hypothetical protein